MCSTREVGRRVRCSLVLIGGISEVLGDVTMSLGFGGSVIWLMVLPRGARHLVYECAAPARPQYRRLSGRGMIHEVRSP
jgi:hypothetical protein